MRDFVIRLLDTSIKLGESVLSEENGHYFAESKNNYLAKQNESRALKWATEFLISNK